MFVDFRLQRESWINSDYLYFFYDEYTNSEYVPVIRLRYIYEYWEMTLRDCSICNLLVLKSNSRSIGCSLWIFNSIISVVMDIARKKIRLSYWINEDYYFETNKLHKFVKDIVNIGFYSISGRNYMKLKFHWISIYTGFFSWYLIKDFLIQEKMGKWKLFDRWKWILLISYQHCYTQNKNWNKYQLL